MSCVIYALSLEDNTSTYIDLSIFTFSENTVQEADVQWDDLRLMLRAGQIDEFLYISFFSNWRALQLVGLAAAP